MLSELLQQGVVETPSPQVFNDFSVESEGVWSGTKLADVII